MYNNQQKAHANKYIGLAIIMSSNKHHSIIDIYSCHQLYFKAISLVVSCDVHIQLQISFHYNHMHQ